MNLKYTKLVIERSRFAAGQYDINLANEADREIAAMQARIEKLEEVASAMNVALKLYVKNPPEKLLKILQEYKSLKGDK